MLCRLGSFIGLNHRSLPEKSSPNAKSNPAKVKPLVMLDAVQEIAIYFHRFHNLDLFQQGWYRIKISMRWEDSEYTSLATPARVVQYEGIRTVTTSYNKLCQILVKLVLPLPSLFPVSEKKQLVIGDMFSAAVPDLGPDDINGTWMINDKDNSFLTQPFRIKYARQDVVLAIMVSFNLSLCRYEGSSTSAVILKFELIYAPLLQNRSGLQASLDASPAAVHEFRIPPKALLGLHSYCPVHFDAFHAVLVDVSVHISLLKAGSNSIRQKVHSNSFAQKDFAGESIDGPMQALCQVASMDMKEVLLVKALLNARDILLEELIKFGKAIDQAIDLADFAPEMGDMKLLNSVMQAHLSTADGEVSRQGKLQNGLEKTNAVLDFQSNEVPHQLPKDFLQNTFQLLGDQLLYLWNTFLKFHRANKTKILDYLHDSWAKDRRAEWSIWMVYSKVEMPHHYINSGIDEPSNRGSHRRVSSLWKLTDDPAQTAATRAELHRRSIAQMRINNRFIQDMHIFCDPSRIPIMIVERVMNAPRRTFSANSYLRHVDPIDLSSLLIKPASEAGKKLSGTSVQRSGRDLKIVVFVHGFQGHHLDLRLVRNQWLLLDPKIQFLMSEANEDKTSGDFREMGLRLAEEVISFVKKKMDKVSRSGGLRDVKLSFVGHSIGNVIIRTALAESIMEPYLSHLYTYVSVSGPHLGYLYSSNSLFNSGLWLLKKLKGTQCIHQLTFTDDPDLQNTFFYKLCKQKTLESFRNIILLSSPQDGYVPYHSARIESCHAASLDHSKKGRVFLEMLNNCLDQIRAPSSVQRVFMRCDVNFDTTAYGRNLNSFIGRAAHIEFLESDIFAKFMMWSFPELFC